MKNHTTKRIGKFTIIGIVLAIFNFLVYTFLARVVMGNNELLWLDSIISYALATILAYILHSKITWQERRVTKRGIIMFFVWNGITAIAISPLFTWLFKFITPFYLFIFNISETIHLPFDYNFIESSTIFVLVSIITMVINFIFYDKLVFGNSVKPTKTNFTLKTTPLVSVIIPVYNTAKFLRSCLDSVINQTYQNLEIICINDGSTDSSVNVLNSYAKKDSRFIIISQKNGGLSSARNTGLRLAKGEYITFIDSDDEVKTTMIESLLAAAISTNSNLAVCSFTETYPNGKTKSFPHSNQQQTYTTKQALASMLKEQDFNLTATMKLYQKSILKNLQFPINKLHEDVGFTYRAIMNAKKIVFTPENDYIYRHHSDSIVVKFNDQKFDLIELTDKMCDDINHKYPCLENNTKERRMRASFSLLRQIPLDHPRKKQLLDYLKSHKSFITKNPEANCKDKLALKLALISPKLFQLLYKLSK